MLSSQPVDLSPPLARVSGAHRSTRYEPALNVNPIRRSPQVRLSIQGRLGRSCPYKHNPLISGTIHELQVQCMALVQPFEDRRASRASSISLATPRRLGDRLYRQLLFNIWPQSQHFWNSKEATYLGDSQLWWCPRAKACGVACSS